MPYVVVLALRVGQGGGVHIQHDMRGHGRPWLALAALVWKGLEYQCHVLVGQAVLVLGRELFNERSGGGHGHNQALYARYEGDGLSQVGQTVQGRGG